MAKAEREGRIDLVPSSAAFEDCGTPADYLCANLAASGGESVVGDGATVDGELVRSVVWPVVGMIAVLSALGSGWSSASASAPT